MANDAFEIARKGGKYSGFYETHKGLTRSELLKSIRSSQIQIEKHSEWISNPLSKNPNFYQFDIRRQRSLIDVHWPADIRRHQDQIAIIKGILKERG